MTRRVKRALGYAFIGVGQVVGVLNAIAAAISARDGRFVTGLLYLVIAIAFLVAALLAWYSMTRTRPYRWRDGGDA
jgi:hypothetical protein